MVHIPLIDPFALDATRQLAVAGLGLHTALSLALVWRWWRRRETWMLLLAFVLACSALTFVVVILGGRLLGDSLLAVRALVLGLAFWALTAASLQFLQIGSRMVHRAAAWGLFVVSVVVVMAIADGGLARPGAQRVQCLFALGLAGLYFWGGRRRPDERLGLAVFSMVAMAILCAMASWDAVPAPLVRSPGLLPATLFVLALLRADGRRRRLAAAGGPV